MGCAPDGPSPAGPEPLPLRVEYAGCETVLRGPVCVLKESRKLRLWVWSPDATRLELTAGGRPVTAPGVRVAHGQRFALKIPEAADETEVRATAPEREPVLWTLTLADPDRPAWLRRANELKDAGQVEAERLLLEEKLASPSRREQGIALRQLARLELRVGEAERARELLTRAVDAHRDTGHFFDEINDATVLAYLLIRKRRISDARTVLDMLPLAEHDPAETAYWAAHYRGLLAEKTGDYRSALRQLTAAAEQAGRVGMDRERRQTEQAVGWNLQRLGRSQEAARLFSRLQEEARRESLPCDRALLLNNHAWSLLLALEAGEWVDDPTPLLEEALEIRTAHPECALSAEKRANVLINLALAHLHGGRPDKARGFLDQARELSTSPKAHLVLWWLDIEARIELNAGRPGAAQELYAELEELAASAFSPEARWRSAVGRARSLAAVNQRPAALEVLAEAEALLDRECLQVPIDEGRETFLAQREAATRFYLDLLLASERPAEALAVARRARSRVLRGLRRGDRLAHLAAPDQKRWDRAMTDYQVLREELDAEVAADWGLPADRRDWVRAERRAKDSDLRRILDHALAILDVPGPGPRESLSPPRTGEVVLAYHPLPWGWVGFAADAQGVMARRIEPLDDALGRPAELSASLLEPFTAEINRAQRLRVLPYGPLRPVDFHALPFGGDVLLADRSVVYGLDLAPSPRAPQPEPLEALLVADPKGDLPAARAEVEAVRDALEAEPGVWSVRILVGTQAQGDAVRRALPQATLFHYAGHAAFEGRGGWESALRLAHETRLTVADILALEQAPEWVVLSGCETGRSGGEAALESIGLAHAFLAAGSRQVIAAVRPVADRAAADLIPALYRDASGAPDLVAVLRYAQLEWRKQDPAADWWSFRVIEP